MIQPYRTIYLQSAPRPMGFITKLRHNLRRSLQRLTIRLLGTWLKRHPWPCLKCGNRKDSVLVTALAGDSLALPVDQHMIYHPCCNETTHAEKDSCYYKPYARGGVEDYVPDGQDWSPPDKPDVDPCPHCGNTSDAVNVNSQQVRHSCCGHLHLRGGMGCSTLVERYERPPL